MTDTAVAKKAGMLSPRRRTSWPGIRLRVCHSARVPSGRFSRSAPLRLAPRILQPRHQVRAEVALADLLDRTVQPESAVLADADRQLTTRHRNRERRRLGYNEDSRREEGGGRMATGTLEERIALLER